MGKRTGMASKAGDDTGQRRRHIPEIPGGRLPGSEEADIELWGGGRGHPAPETEGGNRERDREDGKDILSRESWSHESGVSELGVWGSQTPRLLDSRTLDS